MNKTISDIKSFISRNTLSLVLLIFLLSSITYSIKLKFELESYTLKKNLRGTFISNLDQHPVESTQYFAFTEDKFYRYKQFEILEEGIYEKAYDGDNAYILKGDTIDECIFYTNECFYFYDREEGIIYKFYKFSDAPTFINVRVEK